MTAAPGSEHYVFVATIGGQWHARGCPSTAVAVAVVGTWSGPLDELKASLCATHEGHAEAQLTYAFDFAIRAAAESAAEAALTSAGRGATEQHIYGEQEVGAALGALYEAAGRTPPVYSLPRELQWRSRERPGPQASMSGH